MGNNLSATTLFTLANQQQRGVMLVHNSEVFERWIDCGLQLFISNCRSNTLIKISNTVYILLTTFIQFEGRASEWVGCVCFVADLYHQCVTRIIYSTFNKAPTERFFKKLNTATERTINWNVLLGILKDFYATTSDSLNTYYLKF